MMVPSVIPAETASNMAAGNFNADFPFGTTEESPVDTTFANISGNATNAELGRNEDLAKIEIAVQGLILFLAIFGNGIVLMVLLTRRKKLSRMNLMIIHLSCADLFVAFFNVLPQMSWDITYRFMGGDFMCRSVKYLQVAAMYASSYVLIMTALDRYLAVCHPLVVHTWTRSRLHLLILLAWMLSLLFAIPQLFIFSYQEVKPDSGVYDCWGNFDPLWTMQLYITWFTFAIYVIPFVILTVLYGRICYVVYRSLKGREVSVLKKSSCKTMLRTSLSTSPLTTTTSSESKRSNTSSRNVVSWSAVAKSEPVRSKSGSTASSNGNCNPRAHVKGVSRSKVKTVKLTLTVIACYLLCWGPFFVTLMWSAWDDNAPFTGSAMTIIILLASLNSCCNPWIYLIFTDNLCHKMSNVLKTPSSKASFQSITHSPSPRLRTSFHQKK